MIFPLLLFSIMFVVLEKIVVLEEYSVVWLSIDAIVYATDEKELRIREVLETYLKYETKYLCSKFWQLP